MDKRTMIIERASELFAQQGFDATSVQQITDACGISKGSFYLSFKTKESLLFAIFEYFTSKLVERISTVFLEDIQSNERLSEYFFVQFEEIRKYKDFILMQVREQTNPGNEEMMKLINQLSRKSFEILEALYVERYGKSIAVHLPDLFVITGGMIKGYIEIIVMTKTELDFKKLALFMVDRVDSIVSGLNQPFLDKTSLFGFQMECPSVLMTKEELVSWLHTMKRDSANEDMTISLEVIEEELKKEEPRKPVIIGMLSNLEIVEETAEFSHAIRTYLER
ncbi:TetR/AcrR family transcriptional regulator [Sporosarcina sp. Te-1]|uniref:TetR/AcrR family transcriptional regulator n=1 Tax=Sporosarcina sp. Te-1 TaxID=2818390 RepID=UPI001A9EFB07|nr:TetR/AcrR family transcriptional regulator [Sporosarcina sp. Te-1]QTD41351.1 TetR/AcrR family transcriptional regulator [Sporosarcina sp. Te-1]